MKTILTSCHFFKQNNITSTKHLSEAARVKLKKMSAREKVYTQIKNGYFSITVSTNSNFTLHV